MLRIDSHTFIPLLNRSIPPEPICVPIVEVRNVFSPAYAIDPEERAALSSGLAYGLSVVGRTQFISAAFADSPAGVDIITMGQVHMAGKTSVDRKDVTGDRTAKLTEKLSKRLQEIGKRLDKVPIDEKTGVYSAKNDKRSWALVKALGAAEKTTVDLAEDLGADRLLAAVGEKYVVPAIVRRIARNFPGLFKNDVYDGVDPINIDLFLHRGSMHKLYAMAEYGFSSGNFIGVQSALNCFVKIPAMVKEAG
jgi:hypothetical protein